jgi:hypothetical protein
MECSGVVASYRRVRVLIYFRSRGHPSHPYRVKVFPKAPWGNGFHTLLRRDSQCEVGT